MTKKIISDKKKRGVKTVEVFEDTHMYLKLEAVKAGKTLLEYCEELVKESKAKKKK